MYRRRKFQVSLRKAAPHLLSVAVGSPRTMCRPPQGRPVVIKVASRVHLMLFHEGEQHRHTHTQSVIVTWMAVSRFDLTILPLK